MRHLPSPAGGPAGRQLGECVDRPPCDGCEAAHDDLRDLRAARGRWGWQPLRERRCEAVRRRASGAHTLTACLTKYAHRADAPPSATFCLPRLSQCIKDEIASACRKSCDMCAAAAAPGARSRPLGLWLAYLLSYEQMGRARVSCSGACSCDAVIDAHNVLSRTSVTAVQRIFVRQDDEVAGCCYLTLTVLPQTSSGRTKFKLLSLLFAQQQGNKASEWQPPGIKVFAAPTLGDMMHYSGPADQ